MRAPDEEDDVGELSELEVERQRCERCGGDGCVEYSDAPEVWGEDSPSEVNHLITCPKCFGTGRWRP